MISVVIPAHNEEDVIGRCLDALPDDDLEVVVVCNGCTDATAQVASGRSRVVVESIADASKTAALKRGDELARNFPRVYLDADTVLHPGTIEAMTAVLETDSALVVAPKVEYDLRRSSRWVRAYYRIWSRLPSVGSDIVGCGVYALSAEGRRRFDRFPDLLGDDHFVRDCFAPDERRIVDGVSIVSGPRTVRDLLRRKVRVFTGNRLVYATQPGGRTRGRRRQAQWLEVVRDVPRLAFDVPAYLAVTVAAKGLSHWRQRQGRHLDWGRDDSSRVPT